MDFFNKKNLKTINENLFNKTTKDREIVIEGSSNIIISCPHSATHYRNGQIKFSETETAYLAYAINHELDIPYIYKINSKNEDANYDKVSAYRDLIFSYVRKNNIKLLLDFHELSPERDIAVNLCVNEYKNVINKNIVNTFINEFSCANILPVSIDTPFSASGENNISRLTHFQTGIDALQIEFNYNILSNVECLNKVYTILLNAIKKARRIYGEDKY